MTTQDSTRSYAYHFAKNNDKSNKSLSFNQDVYDFTSNFSQNQQSEKRINSPQADLSKFSARNQKTSQPLKKYTFSILAKQKKPFRKSENSDNVRTAPLTPKYPLNMNKTLRNKELVGDRVLNGQQIAFKKSGKYESKSQSSNDDESTLLKNQDKKPQYSFKYFKTQSGLFKLAFQESIKIRSEQQEQIKQLKQQIKLSESRIESLTYVLTDLQQKVQALQEQNDVFKRAQEAQKISKSKLNVISNIVKQTLFFQSTNFIPSKQQQIQANLQNYEKQYRELMKLVGLDSETDDHHRKMISKIIKIPILNDQNISLKAALGQVQKQKSKLWHHLKKNEAELVRVFNLNSFLSSEITVLVGSCNQEIILLNLRALEQRMMMKQMSE